MATNINNTSFLPLLHFNSTSGTCQIGPHSPFVFPDNPEIDLNCQYDTQFGALFEKKPVIDDLSPNSWSSTSHALQTSSTSASVSAPPAFRVSPTSAPSASASAFASASPSVLASVLASTSTPTSASPSLPDSPISEAELLMLVRLFSAPGITDDNISLNLAHRAMRAAIRGKDCHVINLLVQKGISIPETAVKLLIESTVCLSNCFTASTACPSCQASLKTLEFLVNEHKCQIDDTNALEVSVIHNKVIFIPYLLGHHCSLRRYALHDAIKNNSLAALKMVYYSSKQYAFSKNRKYILEWAVATKHNEMTEWLHKITGGKFPSHFIRIACAYGNTYFVKWIHGAYPAFRFTTAHSSLALESLNTELITLLRQIRCPFDVNSIKFMIKSLSDDSPRINGTVATVADKMWILSFLLTFIEPSVSDYLVAIESNRLSVYEAMMSHPKTFNKAVVEIAISNDGVEFLKVMRKHRFEFTREHFTSAVDFHAFLTVNYLIELGLKPNREQLCVLIFYRQLQCLNTLAAAGYVFGNAEMLCACGSGSAPVVRWLRSIGVKVDSQSLLCAIRHGRWKVLLEVSDEWGDAEQHVVAVIRQTFFKQSVRRNVCASDLIEHETATIIDAPLQKRSHTYYYDLELYIANNGDLKLGNFHVTMPASIYVNSKSLHSDVVAVESSLPNIALSQFPSMAIQLPNGIRENFMRAVRPMINNFVVVPSPSTSVSPPSSHSMPTHIAVTSTSVSSVSIHVSQPSAESIPVPSASASASAPAESMPVPSAESMHSPSASASASGFSTEIIAEAAKTLVALSKAKSKSKSSVTLPKKKKRKRRPTITTTRIPVHDLIPRGDDDIGHDSDSDISIHSFQELA